MQSPFPGMAACLEERWRNVHSALTVSPRDQLQDQLPGDVIARVEESVTVDTDEQGWRKRPLKWWSVGRRRRRALRV